MELKAQSVRVTSSTFEKYLKLNVTLLRAFGLLPLPPNATVFEKVFDILRILAIPAIMNIVIVPNVITLLGEKLDVDIVMQSLSGCTQSGGLEIKYVILVWRRDKLKKLVDSCQNLWVTNHPRGYEILSRYAKRGYLMTRIFLLVIVATATCFTALPFVLSLRPSADQVLPISPGYVINSMIWFRMLYLAQCMTIYICGFALVAVDCLFPVLLINSCGQFDLIRAMLNDINEMYETIVTEANPNENFERFFKANLDECITRHQRLLAHYVEIEENSNLYSLAQMFVGLYAIALGLFNFLMGTRDPFRYVVFIMTGISQVLLCNWSPESIREESNTTNLAIYNLPWYGGLRHSCRTTISLLLMMTQNPVRLTAGKFLTLSMEAFSKVMTDAISIFTVFKTLTQGK